MLFLDELMTGLTHEGSMDHLGGFSTLKLRFLKDTMHRRTCEFLADKNS